MASPYLLLPLRSLAEVREQRIKDGAAQQATDDAAAERAVPDSLFHIDDEWKFYRLRDPYLKSESYSDD